MKYFYHILLVLIFIAQGIVVYSQNEQAVDDSVSVFNPVSEPGSQVPDSVEYAHKAEQYISKTDSLTETSQPVIDSPISYDSVDSMAMSLEKGQQIVYLYGGATIKYGTINLEADYIVVNMASKEIFASGRRDSTGKLQGIPKFTEGSETFDSETLRYNFETGKGFAENIVTEQQDGLVRSEKAKMLDKDTYCMVHGKYSTCDAEHPHFYLNMTKGKVLRNKAVITGRAYLVLEDFPIYFPFLPYFYIPTNNKTYSSGVIIPSYGEERTYGFYLRDGGFYWAASDYFDLRMTGDIYSNGKWAINASTRYRLRYKYNGSFAFSYSRSVTGEKGINQKVSPNFSIRWSHNQDSKANPTQNFSISIDWSTSGYSKENEYENADRFLQNSKSSRASFSKIFPNTPFNASVGLNLSQNTRDSMVSVSLPSFNLTMKSIYPLRKKNRIGPKRFWEDIKLKYGMQFNSSINTKEYLLLKTPYTDWKKGIKHDLPITFPSFRLFNYVNVVPSFSYNARWYFNHIEKYWVDGYYTTDNETGMEVWESGRVHIDDKRGFKHNHDYRVSLSSSTTIYGMYNMINPNWKLKAIRHKMDPSISFSYVPDFSDPAIGYYDYVQIDSLGNTQLYNKFEGAMYGSAGRGRSGSVSFSLNNNIEMKLANENDTTTQEKFKKVAIFDNLGFSSSYNIVADSLKLSPFSLNARTKIAGYTININGELDPYALDERGKKYDKFMWEKSQGIAKLGRITRLSTSFGLNYSSDKLQKAIDERRKLMGEDTEDTDEIPAAFVSTSMPWRVSANYSLSYNNYNGVPRWVQSLSVNGSLDLTPKWKTNFSTGFDFVAMKMTHTNIGIIRDLHCWTMSFDFSPVSTRPYYTFTLRANASMLKDLKVNKTERDFR